MSTLKPRKKSISRNDYGIIKSPLLFSTHRLWVYVSTVGMAGMIFLIIQYAALPLVAQSYTIPTNSTNLIVPQAEPGVATSQLLEDLNAQNLNAELLSYVTHPYIAGRGTLLVFAGDNIQIFEYPTSEMARTEAMAIFGRAPRLATESFFHLYLQKNLIGLYFGRNVEVLRVAQQMLGFPLISPRTYP